MEIKLNREKFEKILEDTGLSKKDMSSLLVIKHFISF